MSEDQKISGQSKKNDLNYWWNNGLKLSFELSGWLVGPLVASLIIGRWLDEKYQTRPWLFLFSTGLAFLITCVGIFINAKKFIKEIEREENNKKIINQNDRSDK